MSAVETRKLIPAAQARIENRVVNSRFIATAAPAFTVEEARAFIARINTEFPDASHNVPAYVIGHGQSVTAHCHDAGEPSGTAGRPMLAVLQGSGLGDVAVVVTRYFGGTKLGTGGLVRAYGDAVRNLLAVLPRAAKVPTQTMMVEVPYTLLEQVRLLIAAHHGELQDERFAAEITMTARFTDEDYPAFQSALNELGHVQLEPIVVEVNPATIMPIHSTGG